MKKFLKNFALFQKAFLATRREAFISLCVLFVTTAIFTLVLWLAESNNNSGYTIWDALVWIVVKYVEDPAEVATAPVTIFGQVVGTMVGILGIAIFAVPAGFIGSGLLDAMADQKERERTENNSKRLHKRFRRIPHTSSWFTDEEGKKINLKCVPRFRSFPHIIMKTGMTEDEIIKAVEHCPDMRLMNTLSSNSHDSVVKDDLIVVNFPLNNEYGCCLDRGSDVTIVAPAAVSELGTGSFAFSLAAMGGFNYVSREISPNQDDPFGFYTMKKSKLNIIKDNDVKEDVESQALHFIDDLKSLKSRSEKAGRNHWFIFLLATTKTAEDQVYLWRLTTDSDQKLPSQFKAAVRYGSTVMEKDEDNLQQFYAAIKNSLSNYSVAVQGQNQPISVSLDNNNVFKSVLKSNIMCRVGGGLTCNSLTLRIGYEILVHSPQHLIIAKEIADALKNIVEPNREIPEDAKKCYLKEGDGFADDYGQSIIFESDPDTLQEMLEKHNKLARMNYEHLDLDGNVQPTVQRKSIFGWRRSIRESEHVKAKS